MTSTDQKSLPYEDYVKRLQKAGVPNSSQEVRLIVAQFLNVSESDLMQSNLPLVSKEDFLKIEEAITKREARKPLERILEYIDFSGLRLHVGADIYKPYRETEDALVYAIELMREFKSPLRILDLGSGSGCVLLSLLYALPNATGRGIDNSPEAVVLAKENASLNGLQDRAEFSCENWSQCVDEKFDLVISNPPRVATSDIPHLMPEMRDYDPHKALDGGEDGLFFFRRLAEDFKRLVKPDCYGFVQIGPRYALKVIEIFHKAGLSTLDIKTNFSGQPLAIIYHNRLAEPSWGQWLMGLFKLN